MTIIGGRFEVVIWYGENGNVYYIVDTLADDDDHPAVVASWSTGVEEL